jgi:hypothetical protein
MAATGLGQVISWYICTVVAFAFVVVRMAVKLRNVSTISLDDGFLLLATGCLIGDLAIQQHMWNLGKTLKTNDSVELNANKTQEWPTLGEQVARSSSESCR